MSMPGKCEESNRDAIKGVMTPLERVQRKPSGYKVANIFDLFEQKGKLFSKVTAIFYRVG
jgi:hypothetical protein